MNTRATAAIAAAGIAAAALTGCGSNEPTTEELAARAAQQLAATEEQCVADAQAIWPGTVDDPARELAQYGCKMQTCDDLAAYVNGLPSRGAEPRFYAPAKAWLEARSDAADCLNVTSRAQVRAGA